MVVDRSAFYGSRNMFDQHRDMRLDIDNMSYEVIPGHAFLLAFIVKFFSSLTNIVIYWVDRNFLHLGKGLAMSILVYLKI